MTPKRPLILACAMAASLALSACLDSDDPNGKGANVPIAYAKRANTIAANPTNGAPSAPGGDLIIMDRASPSAPEHNITASITQGQGDVSGPEVSYDGKKLLFAMRCPSSNTATIAEGNAQVKACTGHWNIWEYDMSGGGLTGGSFRRLTSDDADDVDPTYLPGGRGVVFTSNRQTQSKFNQGVDKEEYFALDEYERERVFNLHTLDAEGKITQISFNQSHDRSPVVRQNGEIMFSRWDHVGGRNHFKIFRVKPDGTDMFVLYGAHSEGNSFLHPREMDPKGKYKGFVASDLMPLSGTREGGALVFVDVANYSEQGAPVDPQLPPIGGQSQPTAQELNDERGLSMYGRVTTPYPLWDGSDRVLLSYTPCQVRRHGEVIPCVQMSDAEKARLAETDRMVASAEADDVKDNVPPSYGIYMGDPAKKTWLNVAAPPSGFMYTHPVALQARDEPSTTDAVIVDADLAAQKLGTIEVRSVYDTDGLGRMGLPVLVKGVDHETADCPTAIPLIAPTDKKDTRALIPDLAQMRDPARAAYGCAPARFIRVFRAVAPVENGMGMRAAIGETDFEMQKILGYAPIEPDGSFKLQIPADTPIGLAVVDSEGRAFQTHTNWIQVRPGERRTCDGCHSPRRGGAINSGELVNGPSGVAAGVDPDLKLKHRDGETMAGTRTRLFPAALNYTEDITFSEFWADKSKTTTVKRPDISIPYSGLVTTKPVDGFINYPEHIQPLWTVSRGTNGANTCTNCHNDSAKLDLRATMSGAGRLTSYQELMVGDPVLDPLTGLPKITFRAGIPMVERSPALVDTGASEGDALGLTRKSRLAEILWNQQLFAETEARRVHPNPPIDHSAMLNASEKRLIAEWIDLGGKYYNNPFDPNSGVTKLPVTVNALSQKTFDEQVFPILRDTCAASCHQAVGSTGKPAGSSFLHNRFVLTGDAKGDYNVTLTLISDACTPASNALLSKPSTVPHPSGASVTGAALLPANGAAYKKIADWVKTGCVVN
jgi:hypothetical protein